MTQDYRHPATPPPELVQQWINEEPGIFAEHIAARAAQWGADQELEACCKVIWNSAANFSATAHLAAQRRSDKLRATRRPKPLSLKEQALAVLTQYMTGETILTNDSVDTIRRALEQLND